MKTTENLFTKQFYNGSLRVVNFCHSVNFSLIKTSIKGMRKGSFISVEFALSET